MLPLTLLHLLLATAIITIGITPEMFLPTTPVGPHQKAVSQSTTHVHQVGVFPMAETMVYGQRQDLMILHTTVQMKEYLSAYHLLQQLGIQLRVIATSTLAVSEMSATTATIGLPLPTSRTACTSTTMASSLRRTTTIARTVYLSVVSK